MEIDDLALMDLRADGNFVRDDRGRLLRTNEPRADARQPAPRLFLGRTGLGHVVRFGATVPAGLADELGALFARDLAPGDTALPPATSAAVRAILERDSPVVAAIGGPAYRFPASLPCGGGAVRLTAGNRALLRVTYPWLYDELEDWQPCFAAVDGDRAVSVCFSSRIGPATAEAGLDTLPDHRRRGHAVAVTAAWAAAVRASGRVPLHSTAWSNLASQGVARRLGLVMFGEEATWT